MNYSPTKISTFIILPLIYLVVFSCSLSQHPQIKMKTELGDIIIELYPDKASVTANNFLKYIEEDRFEGATFYRAVTQNNQPNSKFKIEVIQGGLFEDFHPQVLPPIQHETTLETGILHKDGVISMARNEPGTATGEFFICIGDQPELDYEGRRNPDGKGFAAFGRVVKGMDIVKIIQHAPENGQYLTPRIAIQKIEIIHN